MHAGKGILIVVSFLCSSLTSAAADDPLAPIGSFPRPPSGPVTPVTETIGGQRVTDNYRYMEALASPTIAWMKAQGTYTRSVLDAIKPLANLKDEVAKFSA